MKRRKYNTTYLEPPYWTVKDYYNPETFFDVTFTIFVVAYNYCETLNPNMSKNEKELYRMMFDHYKYIPEFVEQLFADFNINISDSIYKYHITKEQTLEFVKESWQGVKFPCHQR